MSSRAVVTKRHSLSDRGDDFYATPIEAVEALLEIERAYLPRVIWEPACGDGAIVMPMRQAGYVVRASDLVARGCPDSISGHDFLMPFPVPENVEGIVTNPPFKFATAFVERALTIAPYVAMLLRLAYLESEGRMRFFQTTPLARIHVSSRRLPMMHRHGWHGPKSTSATAFAWFVWDRQTATGAPTVSWFDWKRCGESGDA